MSPKYSLNAFFESIFETDTSMKCVYRNYSSQKIKLNKLLIYYIYKRSKILT